MASSDNGQRTTTYAQGKPSAPFSVQSGLVTPAIVATAHGTSSSHQGSQLASNKIIGNPTHNHVQTSSNPPTVGTNNQARTYAGPPPPHSLKPPADNQPTNTQLDTTQRASNQSSHPRCAPDKQNPHYSSDWVFEGRTRAPKANRWFPNDD